jgi:hypothetical protein
MDMNNTLRKIDEQISYHQEELRKLQAAREVIVALGDEDGGSDGEETQPVKLTDMIENIILHGGPMASAVILEQTEQRGHEATRGTVYTTLSRMKANDRLLNDDGKWDLTAKRRRQLSK